jgi:replicative DNA helicase
LEAEHSVLGAILLEPNLLPRAVEIVTPEDFYKDAHRRIFAAMIQLFERGEAPDTIMVAETLRRDGVFEEVGGHTTLAGLQEQGTVATQLVSYARIVREYAIKRRVAQQLHELTTGALNGHTPHELREKLRRVLDGLEETSEDTTLAVDAVDMMAHQATPAPGLVVGVIERATLNVVGGAPKLGKTALATDMIFSIGLGRPWLGFPTTAATGLAFQGEIPPAQTAVRLRLRAQDLSPFPPGRMTLVHDRTLRLDDPTSQGRIRALVRAHAPALVVFDPLARYMLGNENLAQDMGKVVAFLDGLIQEFGVTVLLVHHTGKPGRDDPREGGQRLRGSSALFAAADSVLMLERNRGLFTLSFELRHAPAPDPLILQRTDRLGFERAEVAGEVRVVAELAGDGKRFSDLRTDLMELQGVSKATAARLIGQAKKLGVVIHKDGLYRSQSISESHGMDEPEASGDDA